MNGDRELHFFLDIFKKNHIRAALVSPQEDAEVLTDLHLSAIVGYPQGQSVQKMLGQMEERTRYLLTDELQLQYIYMRLPLVSERNILFIGPYLGAPLPSKKILEIGEHAGLEPAAQKLLQNYYATVPIIPEGDRIFSVIDSLCEELWQTSSFAIVEIRQNHRIPNLPVGNLSQGEGFDEIEASIKMLESRYAFENELMRAVSLGQQHKASLFIKTMGEEMFERRTQDSVRNAKNYGVILNTLLRKAAEEGGVHPLYIDRVSSNFAVKIERATDAATVHRLMPEMFSSYCRLVYKHTTSRYSSLVEKTVLVIDSDISAELSLAALAAKQGVSAGHLATTFKREVGKTVSEYIKDKRMEYAMHLLGTTHLQIQTVALHCGIMDVQYFSKMFKKKTGKTPKEYRAAVGRRATT